MQSSCPDFLFIHNPKTGGVSVREFLILNNLSDCYKGHRTLGDLVRIYGIDTCNTTPIYSIIRNPLDRLVSSYFYSLRILKDESLQNKPFKRVKDRLFVDTTSFRDFVIKFSCINCEDEYLPEILRSQSSFVSNEELLNSVRFWAFEDIGRFFSYISSKYTANDGVEFVPHCNKSSHEKYLSYYDDELIHIVSEIYKEDFELYEQVLMGSIENDLVSQVN